MDATSAQDLANFAYWHRTLLRSVSWLGSLIVGLTTTQAGGDGAPITHSVQRWVAGDLVEWYPVPDVRNDPCDLVLRVTDRWIRDVLQGKSRWEPSPEGSPVPVGAPGLAALLTPAETNLPAAHARFDFQHPYGFAMTRFAHVTPDGRVDWASATSSQPPLSVSATFDDLLPFVVGLQPLAAARDGVQVTGDFYLLPLIVDAFETHPLAMPDRHILVALLRYALLLAGTDTGEWETVTGSEHGILRTPIADTT